MIPEKYYYALIDFLTIIFPLGLSFLTINPVYKKWKFILPSVILPGILFLVWDAWFTYLGVWGFNPRYVSGSYIYNLPLEEVLFFLCIPGACLFTYEAVNFFFKKETGSKYHRLITIFIFFFGLVTLAFNTQRAYTALTFTGLLITLAFVELIWKPDFLGRFYIAFGFILIPFLVVNGILTGTGLQEPIVWYNNEENLELRLISIPFEDVFYGMLLILLNISLFELFQKRRTKTNG
jgi:lycopene cyclase domain-containing protein